METTTTKIIGLTEKQQKRFVEICPFLSSEELGKIFGIKSRRAIHIAAKLGVRKDRMYKSKMAQQNASKTRDVINYGRPKKLLVAPMLSRTTVTDTICQHFNINIEFMRIRNRGQEYVFPRYTLYYFLSKYAGMSLSAIAIYLDRVSLLTGKPDHGTVSYAIKEINNLLFTKQPPYDEFVAIEEKLKAKINQP